LVEAQPDRVIIASSNSNFMSNVFAKKPIKHYLYVIQTLLNQ
jgi:hypothetical protein